MALLARRRPDEIWRDAVARRAHEQGRHDDGACLAAFEAACARGVPEAAAAFAALSEHDLLWEIAAPEDPGIGSPSAARESGDPQPAL